MRPLPISSFDLALARVCEHCPVCRRARRRQRGLAFRLVERVEARVCPFCRAYERVHGRKAHEGITPRGASTPTTPLNKPGRDPAANGDRGTPQPARRNPR